MFKSHRGSNSEADPYMVETSLQPNLVDVNDYCKSKDGLDSTSFRPAMKPLKWSKIKQKMRQKGLEMETVEMPQKRIIYVKTFNHVKNEPIVAAHDQQFSRTTTNRAFDPQLVKNWPKHRSNKKKTDFDSAVNLSFFKKNAQKFNPLKPIKPKKVPKAKPEDDNSAINEFAFLTGVNIAGPDTYEDEEEEENQDEVPAELNNEPKKEQSTDKELDKFVNDEEPVKLATKASGTNFLDTTNLPPIKRPIMNTEIAISVSEAKYQRYKNAKPKIYISHKTNSVQPFGRPANYQDHLVRVYNKEATPSANYPLPMTFGTKKDYKKNLLDAYISQFNLEALKDMDEELYEYAKEKLREKEEKGIAVSQG